MVDLKLVEHITRCQLVVNGSSRESGLEWRTKDPETQNVVHQNLELGLLPVVLYRFGCSFTTEIFYLFRRHFADA